MIVDRGRQTRFWSYRSRMFLRNVLLVPGTHFPLLNFILKETYIYQVNGMVNLHHILKKGKDHFIALISRDCVMFQIINVTRGKMRAATALDVRRAATDEPAEGDVEVFKFVLPDGSAQRAEREDRGGGGLQGDLGERPQHLGAAGRAGQQRGVLDAGAGRGRVHGGRHLAAHPAGRRHRLRQFQQRAAHGAETRVQGRRRLLHRGQTVPQNQLAAGRTHAAAGGHERVCTQNSGWCSYFK